MLKASLQAAFAKAHIPEYQFFREYDVVSGTAVIVGFNDGQPLTSFRLFNKSLTLILFEKDVFLERKIKSARWVLGQEFEYHITALGEMQDAQTLFVPVKNNKMVKEEATFDASQVEELLERSLSAQMDPSNSGMMMRPGRPGEEDTRNEVHESDPFLKQISFLTQPLDNFKLSPQVILVEDKDVQPGFLTGASRTIQRHKPTVMLPNQMSLIIEAATMLGNWNFRPYIYLPKSDILQPYRSDVETKVVFFIHRSIFDSEEQVKLRP